MLPATTTRSDAPDEAISIDDALSRAGGFGRFQRRMLVALMLAMQSFMYASMLPVLLLPRLTGLWHLDGADTALIESTFFVGQLVGQVATGMTSDRLGRRICTRVLIPASFALCFLHFACTNVQQLVAVRAVCGFASGGMVVATSVVVLELCPCKRRSFVQSMGFAVGWVGGLLLIVLVDWAFSQAAWQWLALAALPPAPIALLWLPESPHFLLARGKPAEALDVLRRIGDINGSPLGAVSLRMLSRREESARLGVRRSHVRLHLRALRPLLLPLLLAGLAWAASTAAYFGVVVWPVGTGNELRLRVALGGLMELPAYVLVTVLSSRLGPAKTWCAFLGVGAIAWGGLACIGVEGGMATVLLLTERVAGTGATTISYVATAAAFPTSTRALGLGVAACCGRLGSALAPPLVHLLPNPTASTALLGAIAAAGAVCALGLVGASDGPDDRNDRQATAMRIASGQAALGGQSATAVDAHALRLPPRTSLGSATRHLGN